MEINHIIEFSRSEKEAEKYFLEETLRKNWQCKYPV